MRTSLIIWRTTKLINVTFSLFATPKPAFIVAYDYLAHWHDLGVALKLISLFSLFISFYDISVVKPLSHASDSLPYIKAVKNLRRLSQPIT